MESRPPFMHFVYSLVAADIVLILTLVILRQPLSSILVLECGLPVLLGFNYLLVRRRRRKQDPLVGEGNAHRPHDVLWLYAGATVFLAGALYGLLSVLAGEFPLVTLAGVFVSFSIGIHALRVARRNRSRKVKQTQAGSDEPHGLRENRDMHDTS